MQLCDNHIAAMKAAMRLRGLDHLIPKTKEDMLRQLARMMEQDKDPEILMPADYNPMFFAVLRIYMGFKARNINVDGCPVCFLDDHIATCMNPECEVKGLNMVDIAANAEFENALKIGALSYNQTVN